MRYLEMTDEERRQRSQHRTDRSTVHRVATAVAVATVGVLATAVLGWSDTREAGLREAQAPASTWETEWAEPAMRRTVGVSEPPSPPTAKPPAEPATRPDDADVVRPETLSPPPAPPPQPAPAPPRATTPTVRQGGSCPAEGATAVTRSGDPAVCTASPGNGRARWRHA